MKMKTKENKGITLISLVITIIILLILVGITVSFVIGEEDGIINRTITSKDVHNRAGIQEKINIALYDLQIDNSSINAENVEKDLIASNLYKDEEIEVLDEKTISINGEKFDITDLNKKTAIPTLLENINKAKNDIEKSGGEANTKTIKAYLIEHDMYESSEIETEEKNDLTDTIKVGNQEVDVPTNRYVVYFEKPDSWDKNSVYAYVWYNDNGTDKNGGIEWPGTLMAPETVNSNIYRIQLPDSPEGFNWQKIIFNAGSGNNKPQTDDLILGQKGQEFKISQNNKRIYAKRIDNFGPLKIYAWKTVGSQTTQNATWPGVDMSSFTTLKDGKTIYYYDMTDENGNVLWDKFIINDGNLQTVDINYNGGNKLYCTINEWINEKEKNKLKESYTEAYFGEWVDKE